MELTLKSYNKNFLNAKLFRVYPELESETIEYLKLLKKSDKTKKKFETSFEIPITTGFFNEEYLLEWDITEIEKHIENEKIESQNIKIENPIIWSCPSRLNQFKLFQMSNISEIEKPIILAYHPAIRKLIVIDGNHRFHIAKNRKNKNINAIILHPEIHLKYMSELNKIQFIIHNNLFVLNNYVLFPFIRQCVLSDNFGIESFYPILDKNYVFSKYRKIKYRLLRKMTSASA